MELRGSALCNGAVAGPTTAHGQEDDGGERPPSLDQGAEAPGHGSLSFWFDWTSPPRPPCFYNGGLGDTRLAIARRFQSQGES